MKKNGRFSERPRTCEVPLSLAPVFLDSRAAGLEAVLPGELRGSRSSHAILRWLLEGDPLGMRWRCARALSSRCLLLPPRRLWLRALARVARALAEDEGRGSSRGASAIEWLGARVEEALADLVEEQAEEERSAMATREPGDSAFYARLGRRLGVDPSRARRICVQRNALPLRSRRRCAELDRAQPRPSRGINDPGGRSPATARR